MSYSKCFKCKKENFSSNQIKITIEKSFTDKETFETKSITWIAYLCDECFRQRYLNLQDEMERI